MDTGQVSQTALKVAATIITLNQKSGWKKRLPLITALCFVLGGDPVSGFFFNRAHAETMAPTTPGSAPGKSPDGNTYGVRISERPLQNPSPQASTLFSRHYGEDFGLVTDSDLALAYKFTGPFSNRLPVASADVDADGWTDLVLGNDRGVFLYRNIAGKRFERQPLTLPGDAGIVVNAALVDLNNDRLPDLFLSIYRHGNHVIFNKNGKLLAENLVALPKLGASLLNAVAFGDLDLDGDLDIAAGAWTTGRWTRKPGANSRNAILWRQDQGYTVEYLPAMPGETLSMLISDINQDGFPDLLVGNDFQMPEAYYLGQSGGKLQLVKRADGLFPVTTQSTMSIDSGDLDNDLDLEIYTAQASGFTSSRPTARASILPFKQIDSACEEYEDNAWKKRCLLRMQQHQTIFQARQKRNPRLCLEIAEDKEKRGCLALLLLEKSTNFDHNPALCAQLKKDWSDMAYICEQAHQVPPKYGRQRFREALKQVLGRNMLYKPNPHGAYAELAEAMNVDITGWSWTARFADLDNDEWQDIYVVNGHFRSPKRTTNMFFRNLQGRNFSNDTVAAGLENYLSMAAYTYIDYDNDADLDIIAQTFDGPIWVYTNNTQNKTGIVFELDDGIGNRTGIGSRIIIHYGAGQKQIREIKASGGFVSFDAPRAHFGLGQHQRVAQVEVIWSTGERSVLGGDRESGFKSGHHYLIERLPAETPAPGAAFNHLRTGLKNPP